MGKTTNERGFIGLIILLVLTIAGVVIFSYLRVKAKQQGLELEI